MRVLEDFEAPYAGIPTFLKLPHVNIKDIDRLKSMDVDILGIGRQIIDAPLLDLRMEIVEIKEE